MRIADNSLARLMRDVLASNINNLARLKMRTTINIDDDLLLAAKQRARRNKRSLGEVVSELLRESLQAQVRDSGAGEESAFYGFDPLPKRATLVTDDLVERLRDEEQV